MEMAIVRWSTPECFDGNTSADVPPDPLFFAGAGLVGGSTVEIVGGNSTTIAVSAPTAEQRIKLAELAHFFNSSFGYLPKKK